MIVYKYPDAIENANKERHAKALANYALKKAAYDQALANYPDQLAEYQKSHGLWLAAKTLHQQEKLEAARSHKKYHAPQEMKEPKPPSKSKAPSLPDVGNQGHIEVRTYDGYMSDFKATSLANANKFVPIAVYRKFYDPLPDLRVRAFLEVIASKETKGIPLDKSWYALNEKMNGSEFAVSIDKHPWLGVPITDAIKKGDKSTAAGRYQLTLTAWNEAIEQYAGPEDFLPASQMRLAVIRMEYRQALGLIRQGEIEEAVEKLKREWVVLKAYPISQLLTDYQKFMELLNK